MRLSIHTRAPPSPPPSLPPSLRPSSKMPFDGTATFRDVTLPDDVDPDDILLTATAPGLAPSPGIPASGGEAVDYCPLKLAPTQLAISSAPAGLVAAGAPMRYEVCVIRGPMRLTH